MRIIAINDVTCLTFFIHWSSPFIISPLVAAVNTFFFSFNNLFIINVVNKLIYIFYV